MRLKTVLPLALLALTVPGGARAQTVSGTDADTAGFVTQGMELPERHFMFNVGGGLSFPVSDAGDRFETGGGFQLGFGYQFQRSLGIMAEYFYSGYDIRSDVLTGTGVDGNHYMQYGSLNAVWNVIPRSTLGFYFIAGPGVYYRTVDLTQLAGVAAVPYCDPWLYYCATDVVPVTEVLGSRSSTDFGLSGGVGVTLKINGDLRLYVEGRYHYIFGSSVDVPGGDTRKANGQYIPVNFGIRY
ncbi:outer membrane beta-barrel protein [Corallococcus sp. bb12-1]|uniref:outer membrane beta-barrel protein n=1 Tax=Corallococcus sp. bb12-1 TaxID=2996784 RepID=UPI0022716F3A|nr:outer membrane beta-barrel protein [Corallococcus sp. bb12-1]MCY1041562.1 outer membrane beta-barrel protein [Corallococcus sp. bb12-1]